MKGIIFLMTMFAAHAAIAETLTPMQSPPRTSVYAPAYSCEAASFDATDGVHGYCYTSVAHSSGRSGVRYTFTVYATSWDIEGNVTGNVFCGTLYSPGPFQPAPVFAPGFSATTCEVPTANVGPFVLISPYWYTIKAYSSDGIYEAAAGNTGPVIVAF